MDNLNNDNWYPGSDSNEPHGYKSRLLLLYKPGGLGNVSFNSSTSNFTKTRLYTDSFTVRLRSITKLIDGAHMI
jgi:hypothetical protein